MNSRWTKPIAHATRLVLLASLVAQTPSLAENRLERSLGRNEVRVYGEAYPLVAGRTVEQIGLARRLERLGYDRVRRRPTEPGRYFYGHDNFHIYRRAHRLAGRDHRARLFTLQLVRPDGRISAALDAKGTPIDIARPGRLWVEPEPLQESLEPTRARRVPIRLAALPERVWRPLLAIEDARFLRHRGVDGRAVARALLANVKAGEVAQGGSTITQQLVKNRALSPKRTVGRKLSEAVRALSMEVDFTKEEILEVYLNSVYLGHVDGLAVHGYGAAARVFFSKDAHDLSLAEAATLAAMVQGPNRLSPIRNPAAVRERRDVVLARMKELEWAADDAITDAQAGALGIRRGAPEREPASDYKGLLSEQLEERRGARLARGRGVVVEATLDPWLQEHAERSVAAWLSRLRRSYPRLPGDELSAALVALEGRTGRVLAYVGGDPAATADRFDRARLARRQVGSTIKPLLLLEALETCGDREPLHAASRVSDAPLVWTLDRGSWAPQNIDRRHHGIVTVREALTRSYNLPFARIARWCGVNPVAARLRQLGLDVPAAPPPSLALGALEASPLQLATAFTVLPGEGRIAPLRVWDRVERPAGGRLERGPRKRRRVVSAGTAWIAAQLLEGAIRDGTGRPAAVDGVPARGKTGTSSDLRDAWFVGEAGGVVTAVWVGLDRGRLGLTGGAAAAPLWQRFMERAAVARPPGERHPPSGVFEAWVDPESGLLVGSGRRGAYSEWFRRGARPRRNRTWRPDAPTPVIP